jgi:predicted transcriptional regulator
MVLSLFNKARAISLYKEKNSQVEIAEKLKVSKSTVSRLIKKYYELGTIERLKGSGRAKVILKQCFPKWSIWTPRGPWQPARGPRREKFFLIL